MRISKKMVGTVAGVSTLVAGLGVGGAAIASAAPTSSGATHSATTTTGHHYGQRAARIRAIAESRTLPATFTCAKATAIQTKLSTAESKVDARLTSLAAKEATATSAGDTIKAQVITDRINELTQFRGDLVSVSSLVTARCG